MTAPDTDNEQQTPASLLILYGVAAGIYLLYTIAWAVAGFRIGPLDGSGIFLEISTIASIVLAVIAPALWFIFALSVGRRDTLFRKFILLVAGAAFLVPWPFLWGTGL